VTALRERRHNAAVGAALEGLTAAARSQENLMPRILAAVEAYATLGEISDVLRTVFGEQHEERTV
jgi:methylmalonyl-CoA mutase N-terminal domain/subunit